MVSSSRTRQAIGAVFRPGQAAPPDEWNLGRLQFLGDDIEPLRLARREDQQKVLVRGGEFLKSLDHGIVFVHVRRSDGRHGAGGDPDLLGARVCSGIRDLGRDAAGRADVKSYFRLPATFTFTAGAPARYVALGVFFGLHIDRIGPAQNVREKSARALVARQSALRDASVDDQQGCARRVWLRGRDSARSRSP